MQKWVSFWMHKAKYNIHYFPGRQSLRMSPTFEWRPDEEVSNVTRAFATKMQSQLLNAAKCKIYLSYRSSAPSQYCTYSCSTCCHYHELTALHVHLIYFTRLKYYNNFINDRNLNKWKTSVTSLWRQSLICCLLTAQAWISIYIQRLSSAI